MAIKWKVDPAHSEIQFKAKHLMITTVTGYFRKFYLDVETETEDFTTAKKYYSQQISIRSIQTVRSEIRI